MPRTPRIDIPGLTYHVFSRGVKRLPIFHDDLDRHQMLRFLIRTRYEYPFVLHAYCLMSNHYHLLLQTVNCSLSKTMHHFKTLFSQYFNRRNGHVGHVFQSRFHSLPVQTDAYFTTVARYIHLNPVRAGIVERPEDYAWSNYGKLIRGEADPLVDSRFLLDYFGRDMGMQRETYRLYVQSALEKPEPITDRILQRMRFWGNPPIEHVKRQSTLSQQTV